MQRLMTAAENYGEIDRYLKENGIKKPLLVCGGSLGKLAVGNYFETLGREKGIRVVKFDRFRPNPSYEEVVEGVDVFCGNHCDSIIAVGGGSAIDVAKCIKLFCNMDRNVDFLQQKISLGPEKFLAVPTTAGSGSEATRYAVIYHEGEKLSISHEGCIPEAVLMDSSVLKTLPLCQKKATMLDALCHSIESFWSVRSTPESREYSRKSLSLILENMEEYMAGEAGAAESMLEASHIAGKAINIAQTTAGHAMCYKLTILYGIPHGHAAALCVKELWPWMVENVQKCIDPRGRGFLEEVFGTLALVLKCRNAAEAAYKFSEMVNCLELEVPLAAEADYEVLKRSVNSVRLKNNPVEISETEMEHLYHMLLERIRGEAGDRKTGL